MTTDIPAATLEKFTTFGDLLRFLRRRVGLTQMELASAVGYSDAQISRLEQNLRLPDIPTIKINLSTPSHSKTNRKLFHVYSTSPPTSAAKMHPVWVCAPIKD